MSEHSQELTNSPATSLRHFPTHERAHSEPHLPPEPLSSSFPPSNASPNPRISFSGPETARTRSTSLDRPPTPHRGYSLAIPSPAVGPSSPVSYAAEPSEGSRRRRNISSSSRGGEGRAGDDDEELELAEAGRRGLRDVKSRDTIRTSRTNGTRIREKRMAASPCPTAASASPCVFFHSFSQRREELISGSCVCFHFLRRAVSTSTTSFRSTPS